MDYFNIDISDNDMRAVSNLGLAHIGDAVYELMVRTMLLVEGKNTNYDLHRAAVARVSARAQAEAAGNIVDELTEEEREIFKRGRNAHVHGIPHGATPGQYHAATALETLFGYLYLKGRRDRLNELFSIAQGR